MQQQQMMMQMMQQMQQQNPMQQLAASFNGPSSNPISAINNAPAFTAAPVVHAPAPPPPTTVEELMRNPNFQQFAQLLQTAPAVGNGDNNTNVITPRAQQRVANGSAASASNNGGSLADMPPLDPIDGNSDNNMQV